MKTLVSITCVVIIGAIGVHFYQQHSVPDNTAYYQCRAMLRGVTTPNARDCITSGIVTLAEMERYNIERQK